MRNLKPGDVLVIARQLNDKQTGRPFVWHYFGIVLKMRGGTANIIRIGGKEGADESNVSAYEAETTVSLLPEAEWPDGIYAFRTRLILEGRIDGAL